MQYKDLYDAAQIVFNKFWNIVRNVLKLVQCHNKHLKQFLGFHMILILNSNHIPSCLGKMVVQSPQTEQLIYIVQCVV
jgi:hypothetical protein